MFAVHADAVNELKAKHQKPEGLLLEQVMAGPPKVTFRALARRVNMSDARVRKIINGYVPQGGQVLDVRGPAETIARLAGELHVSPDELREAGREDAARALQAFYNNSRYHADATLQLAELSEELEELKRWLEAPRDERAPTPPKRVLALWPWDELQEAAHTATLSYVSFLEERRRAAGRAIRDFQSQVTELKAGGDGNAEESRRPAPTKQEVDLAAEDDDIDSIEEAIETERST